MPDQERFRADKAILLLGRSPDSIKVVFHHGDRDSVADGDTSRAVARQVGGTFVSLADGPQSDARPGHWEAVARSIAEMGSHR